MESTNTQASASKVSLMSVGMQAIMDAYLCLLHLSVGIVVEAEEQKARKPRPATHAQPYATLG